MKGNEKVSGYGFDRLLGTASGAVNDGVNANQGSRNGLRFTEVSLRNGKKRVKRVKIEIEVVMNGKTFNLH